MFQFLKRLFGQVFGSQKPKADYFLQLKELLDLKDRLSATVQSMSDRKDRLNERFRRVMAEENKEGLDSVKKLFQELNNEVNEIRQRIRATIKSIQELKGKPNDPRPAEALDELNEMMKVLQIIVKHHKAVQRVNTPDSSSSVNLGGIDSFQRSSPSPVPESPSKEKQKSTNPPGIITAATALENIQSQKTVLLQISEDMLKPPTETSDDSPQKESSDPHQN